MRPSVGHTIAFGLALLLAAGLIETDVRAASLTLAPDLVYLGSFSGGDATNDDEVAVTTELRIDSVDDWCLELTLVEAPHRIEDAIALPLQRMRQIHPGPPEALLNGGSSIVMRGKGTPGPHVITLDWSFVQNALQSYLRPEDPPGNYETTLAGRLLDAAGDQPLSDAVSLVFEFRIQRWLELADGVPDSRINVYESGGENESYPTIVPLTGNCGWTLTVAAMSDLVRDDGLVVIPAGSVAVSVSNQGGYGEWTPMQYDWAPLRESLLLARGAEPTPFTLNNPGVPLRVKFESDQCPPAGAYHMTLSVSVASDVVSRE
jgi:hypothetical protein